MARDGYTDLEEKYKHFSTPQLKRYASQSNSWGKRLANVEGLTAYFFSVCLAIMVFGGLVVALVYAWLGSWIVLLVGGLLLAIPCLTVIILGIGIIFEIVQAKAKYNSSMAEIERRENNNPAE